MKTNLTYNDKIIQEVADIIREAGPQNLATVVGEIKQLLEQLFQNYPTQTTAEQMEVATKASDIINSIVSTFSVFLKKKLSANNCGSIINQQTTFTTLLVFIIAEYC